jgi:hypothetical protein
VDVGPLGGGTSGTATSDLTTGTDWSGARIIYDENAPRGQRPLTSTKPLGWLSERYEVGKGGSATISSGKGDPGGVSYGAYQLSSTKGMVQRFVAEYYPQQFAGLKPGTYLFDHQWLRLAATQPDQFRQAQHDFIKSASYDPAAARLRRDVGLDVNARSPALQNVLWSTAVQHGDQRGAQIIERAIASLGRKPIDQVSDRDLIQAIYAERGRTDSQGTLQYFRSSSRSVQAGVSRRYQGELRDALNEVASEQSAVTPLP